MSLELIQSGRITRILGTYPSPGSDNDGTIWYLLDRCRAPWTEIVNTKMTSVAGHTGFELSGIPFSNFFDLFQIFLGKVVNCAVSTFVSIISILHVCVVVTTVLVVHDLIAALQRYRTVALVGSIVYLLSGNANNSLMLGGISVYFLGFLAISITMKRLFCRSKTSEWWITWFLGLQGLVYFYWGLFTVVVIFILIIVSKLVSSESSNLVRLRFSIYGLLIGAIPLLSSQIELLFDRTVGQIVRPTNMDQYFAASHVLFTRPSLNWFIFKIDATALGQPLAFLSVIAVVSLVIGMFLHAQKNSNSSVIWIVVTITMLVLLPFYVNFLITGPLMKRIYNLVPLIRSVTLFHTLFLLLLVVSMCITVAEIMNVSARKSGGKRLPISLVLLVGICLQVLETALPQIGTTQLTTTKEVINPWKILNQKSPGGLAAHYPDTYDEFGDFEFGFPNRAIEFAQLGHRLPIANGRDVTEFLNGCGALPNLKSSLSIDQLGNSGVSILILHKRLMSQLALSQALTQLNKNKDVEFIGSLKSLNHKMFVIHSGVRVSESLDAMVFILKNYNPDAIKVPCRYPIDMSNIVITNLVYGPTWGRESNGFGEFEWQTGVSGTVEIKTSISAPVVSGSVLKLKIMPNPCGSNLDTQVLVIKNGEVVLTKSSFDKNLPLEAEVLMGADWWNAVTFKIIFNSVKCTLQTDPRNFGAQLFMPTLASK